MAILFLSIQSLNFNIMTNQEFKSSAKKNILEFKAINQKITVFDVIGHLWGKGYDKEIIELINEFDKKPKF